jgi:type I restriction enzyme M protein
MAISTIVKSIQDIMRIDEGVDGDAQRISQLTWLLFLKIFDAVEEEAEFLEEDYKSPIPVGLRWRDWAANEEGITSDELLNFIDRDLFPALKDLSVVGKPRAALVRRAFEDSFNFMKNGTLLRQVVNKVNEIDFNSSKEKQVFGEIYEKILQDLQSAGNAGEYYTPRAVVQFMVEMTAPQLGDRVFDPACGTGGFLTAAYEFLHAQVKTADDRQTLMQSIRGVEKKPLPHLLCMTNLLLHGVDVPVVERDNTLGKSLVNYKPADKVDVILTNPPFGGKEEDGIEGNFPAAYRTKETADLFLVLIIHLLKEGGRGAIVLPDGTLFGEGVKTKIKRKLLEECNLHTIVRLPNGVFNPYTSIKTNLLFFTKGEPTREVWFYEHPYPPGYKSYSKTKPIRVEEFAPERDWWHDRQETEQAWRVSIADIEANGFNLDIKNPHEAAVLHRDFAELLSEYQAAAAAADRTRDALRDVLRQALEGV